ncbi:MAG: alpha/beta hydrolase family protein [Actinomycetota bacterium]
MTAEVLPVTSDGYALNAWVERASEPRGLVYLLHGIPSVNLPEPDDTGYAGFARRFAERGWTTAWADLRGVRGTAGYFSIEGWVRDAIAVISALRGAAPGVGFLALVGSSAGGAVSAEVIRRGTRADALAMLASPAAWLSFAADPRAGIEKITTEAGMPIATEVLGDPSAWANEFDSIAGEVSIEGVTVPTLIVHGTADDVVPVSHASRIAARAPHAELGIISGAGHILRRDERAVARVLEWLDKVGP